MSEEEKNKKSLLIWLDENIKNDFYIKCIKDNISMGKRIQELIEYDLESESIQRGEKDFKIGENDEH